MAIFNSELFVYQRVSDMASDIVPGIACIWHSIGYTISWHVILTFYLSDIYLTFSVTFYLTYILTFFWHAILTVYLSNAYLTFYVEIYLKYSKILSDISYSDDSST